MPLLFLFCLCASTVGYHRLFRSEKSIFPFKCEKTLRNKAFLQNSLTIFIFLLNFIKSLTFCIPRDKLMLYEGVVLKGTAPFCAIGNTVLY